MSFDRHLRAIYHDRSWNVTDWNLIWQFLNFNFLTFHEPRTSSMHDKFAVSFIVGATFRWAFVQRQKLIPIHLNIVEQIYEYSRKFSNSYG